MLLDLPSITRERVAAELERLAERTADPMYRRAAAALRGKPAGRRPVAGDDAALAEMALMVAADDTLTVHEAARIVAQARPLNNASLESAARRLARKYRAGNRVYE
jgi:hypothetical protein